jgi:hypothetical protein
VGARFAATRVRAGSLARSTLAHNPGAWSSSRGFGLALGLPAAVDGLSGDGSVASFGLLSPMRPSCPNAQAPPR